jgi:hypothetical protein
MCTQHKHDIPSSTSDYPDMPVSLFLKLRPLLPHLKTIILGGLGEPFLDAGIQNKLRIMRKENKKVFITAISNGTTFKNRKKADEILTLIDELHISLNGVSSYEGIMLGSKKQIIMENLKIIGEANQNINNKTVLSLGFIVMKRNIDDIVPATMLARKFGFQRIHFKNMWIHDEEMLQESVLTDKNILQKARNAIKEAYKIGNSCNVIVRSELEETNISLIKKISDFSHLLYNLRLNTYPYRNLITKRLRNMLFHNLACRDPWESIQVFESGEVYLCCNGLTRIGDLAVETFDQIWNGEEVKKYRQGILTKKYYKGCSECKIIFPDSISSFTKPLIA